MEPSGHSHGVPTARLVDVAARAGVSIKTVSNVVNAHPQVHVDTRARVQAIIDELGYRPHAIGRQLRRGRTKMITVALPEIDVPYFAELARHVVDAAAAHGLVVTVEQTGGSLAAERRLVHAREQGVVDGLVMSPVGISGEELSERAGGEPLVLLGEAARPPGLDHVGIDDVAAAEQATTHLLRLGRRRVAFLGGSGDAPYEPGTSLMRRAGWASALVAAGVQAGPHLPVEDFSGAAAAAAVTRSLAGGASFDALLCASDVLAIGAMRALEDAGVAPGRDVGVVGWDDVAFAPYTSPTLTSVSPDTAVIASTALTLLTGRIEAAGRGCALAGRHVVVGHRLVVRRSCGSPIP